LVPLNAVITLLAGFAFSSEDFVSEGIQLVRLGNLYERRLDLSRNPVFLPRSFLEKYAQFRVHAGDILFSMTGTMGKEDYAYAVVVPEDAPTTLLNQRVAKVLPKLGVDPNFLLHYLWSRLFLDQIYSVAAGSKQANVSNRDIYRTLIPLPPLEEQVEIAERLGELMAVENQATAAKQRARDLLCTLANEVISACPSPNPTPSSR